MANGDGIGDFDDLWEKLPDPPAKTSPTDSVPLQGSRRAARDQSTQRGRVGVRPSELPESGLGALAAGRNIARPAASDAPTPQPDAASPAPAAPVVGPPAPPAAAPATAASSAPTSSVAQPPLVTAPAATVRQSDAFLEQLMAPEKQSVPSKRHGKGPLVWLIILALTGTGLFFGGKLVWDVFGKPIAAHFAPKPTPPPVDYDGSTAHGEVTITVPEGENVGWEWMSNQLYEDGVTMTPRVFAQYVTRWYPNATLHPGTYRFQKEMKAENAFSTYVAERDRIARTIRVFANETQYQILEKIAGASESLTVDGLLEAAQNPEAFGVARIPNAPESTSWLEGWLAPGDYEILPDDTAQTALQRMVDNQKAVLAEVGVSEADAPRILTIASIIQREGKPDESDYGYVSRVIYNRMEWNDQTVGLLQMDSTAQYGVGALHDGSVWSSAEALASDNPWNTYRHQGLPIGPIANPGRAAIEAAANPPEGSYLFFTLVNPETGESAFADTLWEHDQNVERLNQWCAEHEGNQFCG